MARPYSYNLGASVTASGQAGKDTNVQSWAGGHRDWMVSHDPPNDVVSGFGGVAMANYLCAVFEGRLEKVMEEFVLASFTDVA